MDVVISVFKNLPGFCLFGFFLFSLVLGGGGGGGVVFILLF